MKPNHAGPFDLYAADRDGVLLHDVLFAPFFAGAAGSGQCWHWSDCVDQNGLWWQFRPFAPTVAGLDPPSEGFVAVAITSSPPLRVWALRGRRTAIAWCRDARADWMAELKRSESPPWVEGAEVSLIEIAGRSAIRRAAACDPWTDRVQPAAVAQGRLRLPAFRRSVVVRIDLDAATMGATGRGGAP